MNKINKVVVWHSPYPSPVPGSLLPRLPRWWLFFCFRPPCFPNLFHQPLAVWWARQASPLDGSCQLTPTEKGALLCKHFIRLILHTLQVLYRAPILVKSGRNFPAPWLHLPQDSNFSRLLFHVVVDAVVMQPQKCSCRDRYKCCRNGSRVAQ